MNITDLKLLQSLRSHPSLTITLPTHRTSPANKQDPIRVKNLVTTATNRLIDTYDKRAVEPILRRLELLVNDIDYRYTLDGMAIFVNRDTALWYMTPFPLKERVIVDETFYTRDLVYAMNRAPRYWVLALSEKPTRLFEGTRETLQEVETGGFPMAHLGPGGARGIPNDPAINQSAYRDEHHRIFFRQVDEALAPFMADDPLPLALAGVDRYLAFFREVSKHSDAIIATLTGNYDNASAHDLGQLIWPIVESNLQHRRQQVLRELEAAIGGQRYASTIGEVWRFAREGRVMSLLVEENYHQPALVDESGFRLTLIDEPTTPEALDDAVDEIIATVIDRGGKVVFLADGSLSAHQCIAAILRY
ncbi:AOC03_06830 family ribosome hibernation factor [Chloroflexus sp.]|uniref:AOC03_06830 family ribosome hibernation factor n=1 Tax=Chloroflexus sp. TaxID=1904827 RepID=UPI002630028E|nr:hypothetical protein [uncultured Chloroflexus sp.]